MMKVIIGQLEYFCKGFFEKKSEKTLKYTGKGFPNQKLIKI